MAFLDADLRLKKLNLVIFELKRTPQLESKPSVNF